MIFSHRVLGKGVSGWVEVYGLRLGYGWWVAHTHTYYKFTHKFLTMLFLVTIRWCLPACFSFCNHTGISSCKYATYIDLM